MFYTLPNITQGVCKQMNKSSRVKNSLINLITGIGGQTFVTVLNFITRTVFISTLGKSYLGINGLFSDILSMLSLTELGLDTAINFKLYKPLAEGDEERIRVLMKFYKTAYRVVGLLILLLGLTMIPALPFLIKDYETLDGLGINAVFIFVIYLMQSATSYLFWASHSAIVKADQKEYLLNIASYAVQFVKSIAQIVILLIFKDFTIYTLLSVLFSVIQNIINAVIAKHRYPYAFTKTKKRMNFLEIKDIFKDLGALFAFKINGIVLKATDNIVLSSFIGLSIVGIYSNYLLFYTTINSFLSRIYQAVKASMGNLYATEGVEKNYLFFETMNFISVVFYGAACVGVSVVANELILCWVGTEYIIAQPFSILIGIEILFYGLKNNLGTVRNTTGAFRQMWYRPAISIAVNIVVSIALVHKLGIYGVLIGTLVADFSTNLLIDPYILHKYSFNNYKPVSGYYIKSIKYVLLIALTGAADMFLCSVVLPNFGWLSVVAHVGICGVSVPMVFLLVYRKSLEVKYLLNIGNRFLKKIHL